MADLSGTKLGRFRLVSKLGEGSLGAVYRGEDTENGVEVAVKVLHDDISVDLGLQKRMKQAFHRLAGLKSPWLVDLRYMAVVEGHGVIVTDYVAGSHGQPWSLQDELDASPDGRLDPVRMKHWMEQLAAAMATAHKAGIAHENLKPSNVLLTEHGDVRLSDCGIASVVPGHYLIDSIERVVEQYVAKGGRGDAGGLGKSSRAAALMESRNYLAPECLDRKAAVPGSDVYSIGMMVHRLLTGRQPIGTTELPSTLVKGLNKGWDKIVKRSLPGDVDKRYRWAKYLLRDLERCRPGRRMLNAVIAIIMLAVIGLAVFYGPGYWRDYKHASAVSEQSTQVLAQADAVWEDVKDIDGSYGAAELLAQAQRQYELVMELIERKDIAEAKAVFSLLQGYGNDLQRLDSDRTGALAAQTRAAELRLALQDTSQDEVAAADELTTLGQAELRAGNFDSAKQYFERAEAAYQRIYDFESIGRLAERIAQLDTACAQLAEGLLPDAIAAVLRSESRALRASAQQAAQQQRWSAASTGYARAVAAYERLAQRLKFCRLIEFYGQAKFADAAAIGSLVSELEIAEAETVQTLLGCAAARGLWQLHNNDDFAFTSRFIQQLTDAAEGGDAKVWYLLGQIHQLGLWAEASLPVAARCYSQGVDMGDALSMNALAELFAQGLGVDQGWYRAWQWYESAALAGHVGAMESLAKLYEGGLGVRADLSLAFEWRSRAAQAGSGEAMHRLSQMYADGVGVGADDAQAEYWLTQAATSGYNDAITELAAEDSLRDQAQPSQAEPSELEPSEDEPSELDLLLATADLGDIAAMRRLGDAYYQGDLVEQDYEQARRWYERAAEAGDVDSMADLGLIYRQAEDANSNDLAAFFWLQLGARADNARAARELGRMYDEGDVVEPDIAEAARHYQRAAAMGDAEAMYQLAGLYVSGQGVGQDVSAAKNYYRQAGQAGYAAGWTELAAMTLADGDDAAAMESFQNAAQLGDARAMCWLGHICLNGISDEPAIEADYAEARRWFMAAAGLGWGPAMFQLAMMYENGQGVDADLSEAQSWYRAAAEHGYGLARERLTQ